MRKEILLTILITLFACKREGSNNKLMLQSTPNELIKKISQSFYDNDLESFKSTLYGEPKFKKVALKAYDFIQSIYSFKDVLIDRHGSNAWREFGEIKISPSNYSVEIHERGSSWYDSVVIEEVSDSECIIVDSHMGVKYAMIKIKSTWYYDLEKSFGSKVNCVAIINLLEKQIQILKLGRKLILEGEGLFTIKETMSKALFKQ